MSLVGSRRWPAIVLAVLVLGAVASVATAIAAHHGVFDDPHATEWLVVLGAVLAGYLVAAALRAGAWAGLTSGAVMAIGLIAIQSANVALLGSRADYQRESAASGLSDMSTYLASDAIAASTTHMVINVGLGLVGATIGAIAAARRPDASMPPGAALS